MGECGGGDEAEPAEEAGEGSDAPIRDLDCADDVPEDEGEDEVSDEGGDHAEEEALLFSGGNDVEGGHPGFGEEGRRVPDGSEEPEDEG